MVNYMVESKEEKQKVTTKCIVVNNVTPKYTDEPPTGMRSNGDWRR